MRKTNIGKANRDRNKDSFMFMISCGSLLKNQLKWDWISMKLDSPSNISMSHLAFTSAVKVRYSFGVQK